VIFESAEYRSDLTAVATAVTAVTATKASLAQIRSALVYYPVQIRLSHSSELLRILTKTSCMTSRFSACNLAVQGVADTILEAGDMTKRDLSNS
jgi:hypothetical protein